MSLAIRTVAQANPETPTSASRSTRRRVSGAGVAAVDLVLLLIAFTVAHFARFPWEISHGVVDAGRLELLVAPAVVVVWMALLSAFRTRDPRIAGVGGDEYRRLVTASLVTGALVAVTAYAASIDIARGYVAIAFPVGLLLLVLGRKVVRTRLAARRAAGDRLMDVLLVGDLEDVRYVGRPRGRRRAGRPSAGRRVPGPCRRHRLCALGV
jgi:FlaA1/EpsC-like NDP-sugar epimerase